MNKILKTLAATALLGCSIGVTACGGGKAAKPEVYTGYSLAPEAGFDELIFAVSQDLVLTGSEYVYSQATLLCHTLGHNIVATHLYNFEGTFTVKSEDAEEGTRTIELSAPTYIIDKNTGSTLADDPDLMDKFAISTTVVLNVANHTATFTWAA